MDQTPVHENHNPDLLAVMPAHARKIVEVGCSSGALAREYRKTHGDSGRYIGIEIDESFAELARRHCDDVHVSSIETPTKLLWKKLADADCWVFGDTLEHLRDPWAVLSKIRETIPETGTLVCCIPNAQHWSIQVRLNIGDFRYADSGLLDKTHLRWFTRQTIIEMFSGAGFEVTGLYPRIFNEPARDGFLELLGQIAARIGADPKQAMQDAMPLQYVLTARPAKN
jgi:ubiquinone/menaquinone biosynthesis C-methylase UbiE